MKEQRAWPFAAGEMAAMVREVDWGQTPLGPISSWPQGLRAMVDVVLAAPSPMILLWGAELVQLYNAGYRDIMGAKHPRGLGQRNRECWGEVWDFTSPIYNGVMRRGESLTFRDQRLILERHGYPEETFFTLCYSPVWDDSGVIGGILVTVFETTEKVRAEAAREVSETEAREAFLLRLGDAVRPLADPAAIQAAAARMLGEQLAADRVAYVEVDPRDAEVFLIHHEYRRGDMPAALRTQRVGDLGTYLGATLQKGHPVTVADVQAVLQLTPGERTAYEALGVRAHLEVPLVKEGRLVAFLAVHQRVAREWRPQELVLVTEAAERTWGVVERARAEAALREAVERYEQQVRLFEAIAKNTPDFVYLFDLEGRFVYVNEALLSLWRLELAGAVGRNFFELDYPPALAAQLHEEIRTVIRTKEPLRNQTPYTSNSGTGYYEYIFSPVLNPAGDVELVAGTTRDITEQRLAADALREADKRKDEFLATLAHELRNPLAPIINAAEVLRLRSADRGAVERLGETIRRQADHMRRLIDDLLDVARITRGIVELQVEMVDLGNAVSGAVQMARPLIARRGHELRVTLPEEPMRVHGDPARLTQVVANLLTNAAKFTPEGGRISLTVEQHGPESVIRVTDTGKGFPAEMQSQIFDLFTQANPSIDRAEGGLGLGLTLVRKLVQMHGGRVDAFSAGPGQGSEFVVRLPAPRVPAEAPALRAPPALGSGPLRILAVDDNTDAADTLADLLQVWGHEVRVAYNGPAALTLAKEHQPDAVLLDVGLPGMDGYAVARELRDDPRFAGIHLVAVTGFGQDEDRARARAAGFDEHLSKPVDPAELRRVLDRVAGTLRG